MNCRIVERWLADGPEAAAGAARAAAVAAHLEGCPKCARLARELASLPAALAGDPGAPPPELVSRTRSMCLAAVDAAAASAPGMATARGSSAAVPLPIRALLALLTGLTIVFAAAFSAAAVESGDWTAASTAGLVLILQNLVMLLCAPLLLRRRRPAVDGGAACA